MTDACIHAIYVCIGVRHHSLRCALTDGTNRFIIPPHPITQDFVPRFAALDLLNDPHELAEKIFAQAQPAAHHHVPSRVLLSTRTHCCVQSVLR